MAEWSDEIPQFSPYVSQQPVEAMAKMGFMREQQFEQGVQTVQNYYDSLLSLPLIKGKVQDYVKQKVGQLNSAVKQSISGDFSDRRLVNQIGGLASQISSDPIVKEGIESTARIQASLAKQKADQEANAKNGKNPVNNINDLNDQINAYLTDGQVNTSFNGGYTPYVDVIDRTIKLFKEQNPGQTIDADAFYYDKNDLNKDGSAKLKPNPAYFKGVDPSRIQAVLNIVYSQPDVQAQLGVDGRQTFKGMDPVAMADYITKNANSNIDFLQKTIDGLKLDATLNGNADKQQINKQIDFYQKQYDELVKENDSNNQLLLGDNPEALKSKLVWENVRDNFVKAYAYKTPEGNPFFDKWLEMEKFEETKRMNQHTIGKDERDYDLKLKEYLLKTQKAAGEEDSLIAGVATLGVDEQQAVFGYKDAQTEVDDATIEFVQSRRQLAAEIASKAGDIPPFIQDADGGWVINTKKYRNVDPSISPEAMDKLSAGEAKKYLDEANQQYNQGPLADPTLNNLYQEQERKWDILQSKKNRIANIEADFKPDLEKVKSIIGDIDYASAYIIQKKLPGWEKELKQFEVKYKGKGHDVLFGAAVGGGGFVPGILDSPGYNSAIKKIEKDQTVLDITKRYNEAYRQSSSTTASKIVTFKSDDKSYQSVEAKFNALVAPQLLAKGGATSDAEAFSKIQKSKENFKFTSLNAYYDANNKKGYIQGMVGDKPYKVEVSAEPFFQQFPELRPNEWFDNNFRAKLDNSRTTSTPGTTDIGNKGRVGSYNIDNKDPDYITQYQIVQDRGQYNIKYWITPKSNSTGPSIVNSQYYFDTPTSEAAIERAVKQDLSSPQIIRMLVEQATKK